MKTRLTPPGLVTGGRRRLAVGMMTLLLGLGLAVETVQAIPSAPTGGRIHGRAPTATGNLTIRLPGGTTVLTNNAQVIWTAKPNDFTLAPLTPGLTYTDADGDLPAASSIALANPPGVTWTWKKGATPLTAAQLSQPLQSNFANGTVLTVSASAPVNVTSVSGLPNAGTQTITTPTYNVVVRQPPPPQKVWVGGTTFAGNAGFPTTGFTGAKFQFYMNGTSTSANGNYTYTTSQPGWTTVSSTGLVSFTRMPTAAEKSVTISISDTTGVGGLLEYTFSINKWFNVSERTYQTYPAALQHCAGLGGGYRLLGVNDVFPSTLAAVPNAWEYPSERQVDGRLWSEWGNMQLYDGLQSNITGWTSDKLTPRYDYYGIFQGYDAYAVSLSAYAMYSFTPSWALLHYSYCVKNI